MITKVLGIAFVGVVTSLILKQEKPEFSLLISIGTGVVIFFLVLGYIENIVSELTNITESAGILPSTIGSVLKAIGIGYLVEFSADASEDAGNKLIANKIVFAGKIIIAILALPILGNLFEMILGIL